ncbi:MULTISPECIES: cytochrome P450 [unclassified Mesorhizobium]|uniref:cytochrome P450 n=1 Tax=unclassified Mesorhizobium TaxID=325217 RepID=UPI000FD93914|nr:MULTISPECIES: cytochrome P450 [unclassified Mesorhizobium]TGQ09675.1 cytochrome P450 [Mesorhizobium sp. M2E.F.Ca.ET.219.01.1.1]TGT66135.1 cytochrome P450 [Mesorhizobium sp. M2E.F.Ca.ET.166.01.1.1]TGV97890.1 cytochrome P450 [Mesorhizobium sp. M2E.F.Ca.ET.154.01.1.1]
MTEHRDLFDPLALGSDPFPAFAGRRKAGGSAWGRPPYPELNGALYVFSHKLVSEALKHPLLLQAPPGAYQEVRQKITSSDALGLLTRSMLLSDPPRHLQLRRPLSGQMTGSASHGMIADLRRDALALVRAAATGRRFDAIRELAIPFSVGVLANILGIDIEDPSRVADLAQCMADALDIRTAQVSEDANEACRELSEWVNHILQTGRISSGGLVARMLSEAELGKWERDDVVANVVFLLFAGQATVVDTFGNALLALSAFPEQLELLESQTVSWQAAAEELLRYCAPVHYAGARIAAEGLQFAGQFIEAGQAVVPVLASANRDEAVFLAGDSLDLRSRVPSTLTFGTGLHICLGQQVARLELAALLEALFTAAKDWRLDLEACVRRPSILLFGLKSAPMSARSDP